MQTSGDRVPYFEATLDTQAFWNRPNEAILADFVEFTAHDSGQTARSVVTAVAAALNRESARSGATPALRDLLTDSDLLSRVMANDRSRVTGRQLSRATMSGVRHAFRSLGAALPPPPGHSRDDLRTVFEAARVGGEQWVGVRRRVSVGTKRSSEVRRDLTEAEITHLVEWLGESGPDGLVFAELVRFMAATGVRIGAAVALRRSDLELHPDGSAWVYVHEKARNDRRPVLVGPSSRSLVMRWLTLPPDSSLWNTSRGPISDGMLRYRVAKGCAQLGIDRFRPHALRSAFAKKLVGPLGLRGAMRAGGWRSESALERHYLRGWTDHT